MPMTAEESLISRLIGTKSSWPTIGLNADRPRIAYADWPPGTFHTVVCGKVILAATRRSYGFDPRVNAWRPLPDDGPERGTLYTWTEGDEIALDWLRAW